MPDELIPERGEIQSTLILPIYGHAMEAQKKSENKDWNVVIRYA